MKKIIKLLESPKLIIPGAFVFVLVVGFFSSYYVRQAPVVNFSLDGNIASSSVVLPGETVDLAFPKAGRLLKIMVTNGSRVRQGETLASLDAGDALGAVDQARGALELAKAQYASLDVQYTNTKNSQDTIVRNAYRTLLSSNLTALAEKPDGEFRLNPLDNSQVPQISGSYTCDREGRYEITPYRSGSNSGFSFYVKGLESGSGSVTYHTPQPLGSCGLMIQFPSDYSSADVKWVVDIPNTRSATYVANKNAYDLAKSNRDQALKQLEANLGKNGSAAANIAQASIDAAEGAYEVALANYKNNLIVAPFDGVITFVDSHLKIGQSVAANKNVITISHK